MSTLTIEIKGLDKLKRDLDPKRYERVLQYAMKGAMDTLRAPLKEYPPPPPESTYVRTGTLGKSWTRRFKRSTQYLHGIVGTNVAYARWVQDRDRQAEVHRGRWTTAQDVVRDKTRDVRDVLERALRRAIR